MSRLKQRFIPPHLLDRLQPSETAELLGTAFVVGAGTGLGAVFFIRLIFRVQQLFFERGPSSFGFAGQGIFLFAPAVGGLLAGPVIAYFAREAKGHGVPEVMQAIALQGGRIRPRVVLAKVIASALCIGSGGSAGREGPIVQVGAAWGRPLASGFACRRPASETWSRVARRPGLPRRSTPRSPA